MNKPIIMSSPMVLALLAGCKTMTRRLAWREFLATEGAYKGMVMERRPSRWQKIKPGDALWVRETYQLIGYEPPFEPIYRADHPHEDGPWTPAIYLPRIWSRITLIVKETRIEHVQSLTYIEAQQEGVLYIRGQEDPREVFARFWDTLHHPGSWKSNPEVVVITFDVVKSNIDKIAA